MGRRAVKPLDMEKFTSLIAEAAHQLGPSSPVVRFLDEALVQFQEIEFQLRQRGRPSKKELAQATEPPPDRGSDDSI